jgi:Sec-independent protein secretion pathway component TatC
MYLSEHVDELAEKASDFGLKDELYQVAEAIRQGDTETDNVICELIKVSPLEMIKEYFYLSSMVALLGMVGAILWKVYQ